MTMSMSTLTSTSSYRAGLPRKKLDLFTTSLHAAVPLGHFSQFLEDSKFNELSQEQASEVLATLLEDLNLPFQEGLTLVKELRPRVQEIIEKWRVKNNENRIQSEEFIQNKIEFLLRDFASSVEFKLIAVPDIGLEDLDTYLEGRVLVLLDVFDKLSKPGNPEFHLRLKTSFEEQLKIRKEEAVEKQRIFLEQKANENAQKVLENAKGIILEMARQLKFVLEAYQDQGQSQEPEDLFDLIKEKLKEINHYLIKKCQELRKYFPDIYTAILEITDEVRKSLDDRQYQDQKLSPLELVESLSLSLYDRLLVAFTPPSGGGHEEVEDEDEDSITKLDTDMLDIKTEVLYASASDNDNQDDDDDDDEFPQDHDQNEHQFGAMETEKECGSSENGNDSIAVAADAGIVTGPIPMIPNVKCECEPLCMENRGADMEIVEEHENGSDMDIDIEKEGCILKAKTEERGEEEGVKDSNSSKEDEASAVPLSLSLLEEHEHGHGFRTRSQREKLERAKRKRDKLDNSGLDSQKKKHKNVNVPLKTTGDGGSPNKIRRSARLRNPGKSDPDGDASPRKTPRGKRNGQSAAKLTPKPTNVNSYFRRNEKRDKDNHNEENLSPSERPGNTDAGDKVCPANANASTKKITVLTNDHDDVSAPNLKYRCNVCRVKFTNKAYLNVHGEFCPKNEKPFICDVCGKGYSWKAHFDRHYRTHSGEKPFGCPKCPMRFSRKDARTAHIKAHGNEKNRHVCEICNDNGNNVGFVSRQSLHEHYLSHGHNEKLPYACVYCKKRFRQMVSLKQHVIIHSDVRPFKCMVCESSFAKRTVLVKHIQLSHREEGEIAKKLANEAALQYLRMEMNNENDDACNDIPENKIGSAVVSYIIEKEKLELPGKE